MRRPFAGPHPPGGQVSPRSSTWVQQSLRPDDVWQFGRLAERRQERPDPQPRPTFDPESTHDFGKDIIPHAVGNGCAAAHPFALSSVGSKHGKAPHWRDGGTIDSYLDANIDLTATDPLLNL